MIRRAFAVMAACLSEICSASEIEIYLMEVPPLTMNTSDRKGVVGDIVLEAMRRAGYKPKLVVVPSNRALAVVGSSASSDQFIIPLARVPEREGKYTWISPVVQVKRAFFTLDKTVNSLSDARDLLASIGVSRGTAGLSILRAAHFRDDQIYEINQAESGFRMLLIGRIDAWFGPIEEGQAMRKLVDIDSKIIVSPPLGTTYNYLGCSKSCDKSMVDRMTKVLRDMDKDGSTRTIMRRYGLYE